MSGIKPTAEKKEVCDCAMSNSLSVSLPYDSSKGTLMFDVDKQYMFECIRRKASVKPRHWAERR
jgi:hypothetical protein